MKVLAFIKRWGLYWVACFLLGVSIAAVFNTNGRVQVMWAVDIVLTLVCAYVVYPRK